MYLMNFDDVPELGIAGPVDGQYFNLWDVVNAENEKRLLAWRAANPTDRRVFILNVEYKQPDGTL